MLKRFERDDILFRQGDPSDFAILIRSGSADVLRYVGDEAIVLGTVQAGEFVGEMGVLENRPRSATVRAAAPVEAEVIERQAFLDRVSDDPELARKLLVRMSVRLRDVEDLLTRLYARGNGEGRRGAVVQAARAAPAITLRAADPGVRSFIGAEPIVISQLPFTVGRQHSEDEAPPVITPDLSIPEPGPYRLSRAHFSLIAHNGEVVVRDLASTLGTVVNDRPIGRDFPVDSATLHQGENMIVAGGRGSPFAFRVTLS